MTLLKITLFCVFDEMQYVYFPHTVHYFCSSMLRLSKTFFYKAHRSEKQSVL